MIFSAIFLLLPMWSSGPSVELNASWSQEWPKPTAEVQKGLDLAVKAPKDQQEKLLLDVKSLAETQHDDTGIGVCWYSLGQYYFSARKSAESVSCFEKSTTYFEKVGHKALLASAYHNVGSLTMRNGDFKAAQDNLLKALPLRREVGDKTGLASTLDCLATTSLQLNDQAAAEGYAREGLDICKSLGSDDKLASAYSGLGDVLMAIGKNEASLDCFAKAYDLASKAKNKLQMSIAISGLSACYMNLADYAAAVEPLEKVIAVTHSVNDWYGEMSARLDLARIQNYLGLFKEAKDSFNALYQESLGRAPSQHLRNILVCLADVSLQLKQPEEVMKYGTLLTENGKENDDVVAVVSGNYFQGQALLEQNKTDEAEARFLEAKNLDSPDNVYSWSSLEEALGLVCMQRNRLEEATSHLWHAYKGFRSLPALRPAAIVLLNLGAVYESLDQSSLAILLGKEAVNIDQQIREQNEPLGEVKLKSLTGNLSHAYDFTTNLLTLAGRPFESLQCMNLLKETQYDDYDQRARSPNNAVKERLDLTENEQMTWERIQEKSENAMATAVSLDRMRDSLKSGDPSESEKEALQKLEETLAQADIEFRDQIKSIGERAGNATQSQLRLAEVTSAQSMLAALKRLGPGTIAVTTVSQGDQVTLILFHPEVREAKDVLHATSKIDIARLSELTKQALSDLSDPNSDPLNSLGGLYDILVRPIEQDLNALHARTIMWSLDGPLRYLPMAALYDRVSKKFVAEKWPTVNFTYNTFHSVTAPEDKQWSVAAFASTKGGDGLVPLPAAGDEAKSIAGGIVKGQAFVDGQFTKESLKFELLGSRHNLVHLATHFKCAPGNKSKSWLLLGDGTKLGLDEMSNWSLSLFSGVDTLGLSACQTAIGAGDGSEFDGLAAMAQNLGAKAVLATLWKVSDKPTAEFMKAFYRGRTLGKLDKARALQSAQLRLIKGDMANLLQKETRGTKDTSSTRARSWKGPGMHPYYWAPFVLFGNWK